MSVKNELDVLKNLHIDILVDIKMCPMLFCNLFFFYLEDYMTYVKGEQGVSKYYVCFLLWYACHVGDIDIFLLQNYLIQVSCLAS